ncbi:MAG: guanylate kinase [Candidatus Hydrogenedentes bacterium]|nr:guanylate kinase [Candidatus Hydrogenedentota bacterium]
MRGSLFVVSAPSGAGKHAILEQVLAHDPNLQYAVSATTRQPREGEVDGEDYHFLEPDEFRRRVEAGEFVEWAEVHGHCYGTLRSELEKRLDAGTDVVMQIDVQGMESLKEAGLEFVSVFVAAPSFEELERRLRKRGADGPEAIALRMRNARHEMERRDEYGHVIVNDVLEEAIADFEEIVRAERRRGGRRE